MVIKAKIKGKLLALLTAVICAVLFSNLTVPVVAATPTVDLVLGGTGATPWNISDIKPGYSGVIAVNLHNAGSSDGSVTIWLSDIINSEGLNPEPETGDTAEPGELGNYLLLNVTGGGIQSDFSLPARLGDYPQSAADTKHLFIITLPAGGTLNLQWEWSLPPATGNDAQGDRLSFTINYVLEEFAPTPSTTPTPPVAPEEIPGVSIKKTGPSDVFMCLARSYTLTVTNTGETALNDVTVTDYFPDILSYQSSTPAGTVTGNQITWNLGTLNKGAVKDIVVILYGVQAGTGVNTATVTTREGVYATDSLTITVLDMPGVLMSITDSSDPVIVCNVFTYTIKVLNQSTVNSLHNITIVGLLPCETVYISADGPTTFTIAGQEVRFEPVAELQPGDTIEFHIKVQTIAAGAAVFKATLNWNEFGESIVGQEGTTIILPESADNEVKFVSPFGTVTLDVLSYISTTDYIVAAFFQNNLTLRFDTNTNITLGNGQSPENIDIRIAQNSPPANEGTAIVSPIYQISAGYDIDGNYQEVYFDRPVTITLQYDPAAIPQNATALYIAYYEENPDDPNPVWVRLDYPPDYVAESGQVSGLLSRLSLFAVIAELSAPEQALLLPPPTEPLQPAKFSSIWLLPFILVGIGVVAPVSYVMMKRRKYRKLSCALADAVNTVTPTTEQLDLYTAKHQERVAELASAIAREMNLPEEQVRMSYMAGFTHDIGKVHVPIDTLNKAEPLSDTEFDVIKQHPKAGYEMLKSVKTPLPVAQIAFQHHERMNGSGYPQKLSGNDILLEARILAVADVVEAMLSPRPYRPAKGLDKALEEIKRNRGILYDSEVVKALMRLVNRGKFRFQTRYDLVAKSEGVA